MDDDGTRVFDDAFLWLDVPADGPAGVPERAGPSSEGMCRRSNTAV
jgi:hypothetical protein